MKLNLSLLATTVTLSYVPRARSQVNLSCVSESIWGYASCLITTCPLADSQCTGTAEDADTCGDVTNICTAVNDCCTGCEADLETMLNCILSDICTTAIECGGGTRELLSILDVEKDSASPPQGHNDRELQDIGDFACLSESVGLYTKCVVNNCPSADQVCTGTAPDGDTCADVEAICTKITNECCPECQTELAALMDCSTGSVCTGFVCGSGSQEPPPSTPSPTASSACSLDNAAAVAAGAGIALAMI